MKAYFTLLHVSLKNMQKCNVTQLPILVIKYISPIVSNSMIDHNDVYQRNFFRARIEFSKIRNSNSAMCVHIICFCKQNFTENPYVIFLVITFNVCNF